jgi:hypothetical protein
MTVEEATTTDWLRLIQAEYREVPGLHLTRPQMRRLWGLDDRLCDQVIAALVSSDFLRETPRRGFVLANR